MPTQPLQFPMNNVTLAQSIAALAIDSANVIVTAHAKKRMRERKVVLTQVLSVLRKAVVVEAAHQDISGDWKCTLGATVSGDRIRVVAALHEINNGKRVIVVTVMT